MQETWVWFLSQEDPLEKEMATHSSIAWRIPWMEEPGGLQSMGSQRVGHDWATSLHFSTSLQILMCCIFITIQFLIIKFIFDFCPWLILFRSLFFISLIWIFSVYFTCTDLIVLWSENVLSLVLILANLLRLFFFFFPVVHQVIFFGTVSFRVWLVWQLLR